MVSYLSKTELLKEDLKIAWLQACRGVSCGNCPLIQLDVLDKKDCLDTDTSVIAGKIFMTKFGTIDLIDDLL
jgi:hypothetical protein